MVPSDEREKHLGWIEVQLRLNHPEFPRIQIIADSHYGSRDHVACVEILGVKDRCRRKDIREMAKELVRGLGYEVGYDSGRGTYELYVEQTASAHEAIDFVRSLRAALAAQT